MRARARSTDRCLICFHYILFICASPPPRPPPPPPAPSTVSASEVGLTYTAQWTNEAYVSGMKSPTTHPTPHTHARPKPTCATECSRSAARKSPHRSGDANPARRGCTAGRRRRVVHPARLSPDPKLPITVCCVARHLWLLRPDADEGYLNCSLHCVRRRGWGRVYARACVRAVTPHRHA